MEISWLLVDRSSLPVIILVGQTRLVMYVLANTGWTSVSGHAEEAYGQVLLTLIYSYRAYLGVKAFTFLAHASHGQLGVLSVPHGN